MKLKRSGLLVRIVVVSLIVYAAISLVTVRGRIVQARADQELLQEKVDAVLQENAELRYSIDHAGDEDTIEEIARTKLGLVKPGEKIFIDIGS